MTTEIMSLRREVPFGLIEFEQREGYRAYHVTVDGKRERFVSVTTFGNVLDRPALNAWREDTGIRNAVAYERAGRLTDLELDAVAPFIRDNALGSEAGMKAATTRGLDVHRILEAYVTTGDVPSLAAFPPEHRGYVRQLLRWLLSAEDRGLEVEATERLVAHPKLKYAGRYDLRARLGGLSHMIDLKTNRHGRAWREHHLQVVAYAHAAAWCGEEEVHQSLVVAVGPDDYEEVPAVAAATDVKAVLDAYRRMQKLDGAIRAQRDRLKAAA